MKEIPKTHYCPKCHAPYATSNEHGDLGIIRDLRAQLTEARQEIERLKKSKKMYHDAAIERAAEADRYASRAAAWKRCAKRWNLICRDWTDNTKNRTLIIVKWIGIDTTILVNKAPPDWRDEARRYLAGEIEMETKSGKEIK